MLNGEEFHEQLPLFVSAGEIKEHYNPLDFSPFGDDPIHKKMFWRGKLQEAKYATIHKPVSTYESIKQGGVQRPVQIYLDPHDRIKPRALGQGHHRVASQADINPDTLIPVSFTHDYQTALAEDDTELLERLKMYRQRAAGQ